MKTAAFAAALALMTAGSMQAHARDVLLGTASFQARVQRDTVNVGIREGTFRAMRMQVEGSDVEVLDLKVIYGNGAPDDIQLRQTFKAGSSSRVIDLKGAGRHISQIIVTYVPSGPVKIVFYGVEAAPLPAQWVGLGCKGVAFNVDHDVIVVGRREGLFTALRLRVNKAPVDFIGLTVTFANGRRQNLPLRAKLAPGVVSRPIDLNGRDRGIDRIDLLYRSIPTFLGKAEVCVDGLQR
jgi:hypothetical protein